MTEWVYKATTAKASFEDTSELARKGFLCKSAHIEGGARAPNVRHVRVGDIVHMYYRERGGPRAIGSFEVLAPAGAPEFAPASADTELALVRDRRLDKHLRTIGYEPDPTLEKLTGWRLRKVRAETPAYDPTWFPARRTLARYLPATQAKPQRRAAVR